jgi:hypothetical protein
METKPVIHHELRFKYKEELQPYYGKAYPVNGIGLVREDLPKCARMFVLVHEAYHLTDKSDNLFIREFKANIYPFWAIPAGFCWLVITSIFNKERREHLINYFFKKG